MQTYTNADPSSPALATDVLGARVAAQLIDALLSFALFAVVTGGATVVLVGASTVTRTPLAALLAVGSSAVFLGGLAAGAMPIVLEYVWGGRTVGKYLLGIRVVDRDGRAPGAGAVVSRNVFAAVDAAFFYLVGIVAIATSTADQRLGDRIAGTLVVRDR